MLKKASSFLRKRPLFLFLLFLSPGFWWIVFQPSAVFSELAKAPMYIRGKITSIFLEEKLRFIGEMRWNAFGEKQNELISGVYYNKGLILVDNFFEHLSLLSPRIYFQAGDGSRFTPTGVEPIPIFFFFLWVFGLIRLIKEKEFKSLIFLFISPALAFLTGRRNFVFLFPALIFYVYVASLGLESVLARCRRESWLIRLLAVYGLFIIGRALWLIR
jgi:hypothetical protein